MVLFRQVNWSLVSAGCRCSSRCLHHSDLWVPLLVSYSHSTVGLVQSFDSIQAAGDISPALVAGGMKVALLTTLLGLIAAMVLQVFYNYVIVKIDGMVNEMEDASITLTDILTAYNKK